MTREELLMVKEEGLIIRIKKVHPDIAVSGEFGNRILKTGNKVFRISKCYHYPFPYMILWEYVNGKWLRLKK